MRRGWRRPTEQPFSAKPVRQGPPLRRGWLGRPCSRRPRRSSSPPQQEGYERQASPGPTDAPARCARPRRDRRHAVARNASLANRCLHPHSASVAGKKFRWRVRASRPSHQGRWPSTRWPSAAGPHSGPALKTRAPQLRQKQNLEKNGGLGPLLLCRRCSRRLDRARWRRIALRVGRAGPCPR